MSVQVSVAAFGRQRPLLSQPAGPVGEAPRPGFLLLLFCRSTSPPVPSFVIDLLLGTWEELYLAPYPLNAPQRGALLLRLRSQQPEF